MGNSGLALWLQSEHNLDFSQPAGHIRIGNTNSSLVTVSAAALRAGPIFYFFRVHYIHACIYSKYIHADPPDESLWWEWVWELCNYMFVLYLINKHL
jgi:hypothetical protein